MNIKQLRFSIIPLILIFSTIASADPIRVYCFYFPNDSVGLKEPEQLKKAKYEKLRDLKNVQLDQSRKVEAKYDAEKRSYLVNDKLYTDLEDDCFKQTKSKVFALKATDASIWETLTNFYPLLNADKKTPVIPNAKLSEKVSLDDAKAVKLNEQDLQALQNGITSSPEAIKSIADKLDSSKLTPALQEAVDNVAKKEGNIIDANAITALKVAMFLASVWFAPAYLAVGARVLYPYVYHVLMGGVPSALSPAYYLLFVPGREHAAIWAFNNSQLIITSAAVLLEGAKWLTNKLRTSFQGGVKAETVKTDLNDLSKSMIEAK